MIIPVVITPWRAVRFLLVASSASLTGCWLIVITKSQMATGAARNCPPCCTFP